MEDALSNVRRGLRELLGPRRYIAGFSSGPRLGTAWPRSVGEVQQIMRLTAQASVAIIPRAAGSNPFAGPAPEAGLIVAVDQLSGISGANRQTRVARVQAGTMWHTLLTALPKHGLMPRAYPSSGSYSTVGGFVAQGGVGIGSWQFGDIGRNLASVRIVDATGTVRRFAGHERDLVVGAQGRTGLIVDVTLRLQALTAMTPVIGLFNSLDEAERSVAAAASSRLPLWSASLLDAAGCDLQSRNWPNLALPAGKHAALFVYRADDRAAVRDKLEAAIGLSDGQSMEQPAAESEAWEVQFASLTGLETTPLPMQYRLPGGRLSAMLAAVPPELRTRLAVEAAVVDGGRTVVARVFFTERARSNENARVAADLLKLAKQEGGRCYTTGAVYLDEAEAVYGPERLAELRGFRQIADPDNRLNPGRGFR